MSSLLRYHFFMHLVFVPVPTYFVIFLLSNGSHTTVSWSTKGKQLAVCITGTLNTQTGPISGPLILQTDPKLRLKRVVQLNTLIDEMFGKVALFSSTHEFF